MGAQMNEFNEDNATRGLSQNALVQLQGMCHVSRRHWVMLRSSSCSKSLPRHAIATLLIHRHVIEFA